MPKATVSSKKEQPIRPLQTRLNSYLAMFDEILRFAQSLNEETTEIQVSVRLEKLEDLWEKVNEAILDVESHEDYSDEEDDLSKERAKFIQQYFEVKTSLLEKSKELESIPTVNQSHAMDTTHSTLEHVRLPQIKLQTFSGNIDEWLSFRDLYTSLIHWKTDLPDVEKFHYLKGCLTGEAKALIDPLTITRANYQVAWDTLTKRYNDSKLLKRRQVQALFKLPVLAKESTTELQSLLEGFERIVQNLDQLVQPKDYKDLLLLNIIGSRLDPVTRRGWEEYSASKEQDSIKDLTDFLQRRIRVLGSLPSKPVELKGDSAAISKKKFSVPRASHSAVQASGGRCVACSETHPLYQCPSFQRLTVSARDKLLRNHSLCRNCFRRGHQASECSSRFVCRNCKAKHHTMVCFRSDKSDGARSNTSQNAMQAECNNAATVEHNTNPPSSKARESVSSNTAFRRASSVLLATAVVLVENDAGISFPARALLDSGSECNFMTESLCQRLNIQRRRSDIAVMGIGQANMRVKHKVTATVKSRVSGFSRDMEFLILPKVTADLPTTEVQIAGWEIPEGVELADPTFFNSKAVDMVLGIQYFFAFFKTGKEVSLGNGFPTLTESVFGWVVSGLVNTVNPNPRISCNMAVADDLEKLLTNFWACEEIESPNNYSPMETRCEEHYSSTVRRGTDGRYTVSLPKDVAVLARMGDSRDIAFRRLQGIERRLLREPKLRDEYNKFMEEYLKLGHMRKVDADTEGVATRCYLPHHPVVRESSTTTKVRVVFDASCKTTTGVSLNDALLVGPVVQEDLRAIILRSRTRQILMVADVEKMFRQIWVDQPDLVLQCILWRKDFNERAETYELCTITYGTKPAPYLATRTLKQLATDEQIRFPMAARAAFQDIYMDDVVTGEDDIESAVQLRIQLDQMMESGGLHLRKWASNSAAVLEAIPEENLALTNEGIQLDPDPAVKTLGLYWFPTSDVFKFQFKVLEVGPNEQLTKRKLLSMIATLFDPLGMIGAVIVTAKIFMQRLWCWTDEDGRKLDWDQLLESKECEEWLRFHRQIPLLNKIAIQRCVVLPKATSVQLHFFSDASKMAYGACAYVRSTDGSGNCYVALLTSKSKVAPLKSQSIPRLELCGALLAAQLKEKVLGSLKIEADTYFWVDSTCVLQWLKAIPATWNTFVANRVAKIQHASENCRWNHVQGVENPADLISRGLLPKEIRYNQLWWEGPSWLKQKQDCWPNQSIEMANDEVAEEIRKSTVHCAAPKPEGFGRAYVRKFSSFTDLVCRTAYLLRFIEILRKPKSSLVFSEFPTAEERRKAEMAVIRCVQREEFEKEWAALTKKESVARSSPLRWFNPQLSTDNVIRVGGRLEHSKESVEAKHPAVLPARHPLTRLLFQHYHHKLLHAGPQLLLATVRLRYWPLGGRNVAREVVHNCLRCFRTKPTVVEQFMGELPAARVTVARPFSRTGVDYFGPVFFRPGPRRTAIKAYVALFVCMCTKAVHLELVTDLSTDRFLQAFKRFIARRGRCTDVYSDNGTNFVGARNQLKQLFELLNSNDHQKDVVKECAKEGINWHFNPPSAPHFGGLWEAAVRSAKIHLLKVLGETVVSFEDLSTLLTQVESCLNSRPLTSMSDDPNDLEPLTPGHFLTGASLHQLPDSDYTDVPMNRLRDWQLTQQKLQLFWKRWKSEYLCQLQGRMKRWKPAVPISVGRLVVIKEENTSPLRWRMGRIQGTHPGADDVVRVVTLKTATGFLKRPVEKICLLPLSRQPPEETL